MGFAQCRVRCYGSPQINLLKPFQHPQQHYVLTKLNKKSNFVLHKKTLRLTKSHPDELLDNIGNLL